MERLFEMDLHDYDPGDQVYSRPSARGVILMENKTIALVFSKKENYYKFPGGGIRKGEDPRCALMREVQEETGLLVVPESIKEFGSVLRRQKSTDAPHTVFEQENFYFLCSIGTQRTSQNLDVYEAEAEFMLRIVLIDEAIETNSAYKSENFFDQIMIAREEKVLRLIRERLCR